MTQSARPALSAALAFLIFADAPARAAAELLAGGAVSAESAALARPVGFLYGSLPAAAILESEGYGRDYLAQQSPERRDALLRAADRLLESESRRQADELAAQAAVFDPASAEAPLLVSRLYMLQTSLSSHLSEPQLQTAQKAYAVAYGRLSAAARAKFDAAQKRAKAVAGKTGDEALTVFEAAALEHPSLPPHLATPKIGRLQSATLAWLAPASSSRAPRVSLGLILRSRVIVLRAGAGLKKPAARLYRAGLDLFRAVMTHAGELYRKYLSGQEMDAHSFRWSVVENLHKEGDFKGSFGHPMHEGAVEPMSSVIFNPARLAALRKQERMIGQARLSPMVGISGMSFPQLSAQSHLSLMYIHLKLAKQGIRHLYNTGEGGPAFHLAILEGDREALKRQIIDWNLANGQFKEGSWDEAKVIRFVDELMAKRNQLFAEFSPEDLKKAQIVAQFGSALNGVRAPDYHVDYEKLRRVAQSPYVAMIQYKLKQAAKRGAKVDPKKIDNVVAAFRDLPRKVATGKAPELNPEMDSYHSVASLILASRMLAKKPISLKFGVGDAKDAYDFMSYLKSAGALPEHIQLDGRGKDFSPGSGNAPPGANTSLPANEAVIVMDAVLKKLGIRDQIFLEATGDTLLPDEGLEKLALGADGISSARLWMGMGLGCAMVRACANGGCPYGIAAKSDSLVGLAMDPMAVGPKGFAAAQNWYKSYTQDLSETGAADWRSFRKDFGLGAKSAALRIKEGARMVTLDRHYNLDYVENLLRGVMTRAEVEKLVFNKL